MITVEKDGVRMNVRSEIQASAFISSGWKQADVAEKAPTTTTKPRATRRSKK